MKRFALVASLLLLASPALAQWVAPRGVPGLFDFPAPPTGIAEIAPAPNLWVDEAKGSDENPGTQAKPRRTIPRQLAAGTVVQILGTQTFAYTSPNTLECQGTAAKPVWLLGGVFTKGGEISQGNCYIDGQSGTGGWTITGTRAGGPSDRIVIRNSTLSGGIAIANNFGSARIANVVLYNLTLTGTYTNQKESGGDQHCITVGANVGLVWVLDSQLNRCNGDGIQINGGKGGELTTGPIFIGRVSCTHNRQSCWWAKQSHDVIVSGGTATDMRPDQDFTNPGACGGGQYFPKALVFVDIDCTNSENGILISGYDNEALATSTSSGVLIAGSRFKNIRATRTKFNATDPYSYGYAIRFDGAAKREVRDTSFTDSDGAIGVIRGTYTGTGNTTTNVGGTPLPPAPVPPVPVPPKPPSKPACPHTFAGQLAYLLGRCIW